MKDKKKKYLYLVISFIVIIGMMSTMVISLKPINKSNDKITAVVEQIKQLNGFSKVTVNFTQAAKSEYPAARKYQVYDKSKQRTISSVAEINDTCVVFPAKKAGNIITVKLLTEDKKEVGTVDLKLRKK